MSASETPVLPPRSLAVAAFSTIVEWYDFTLYLYFATVLSRVFYGGGSAVAADRRWAASPSPI